MELYLDTANVAEVERLARIFPIAAVVCKIRKRLAFFITLFICC